MGSIGGGFFVSLVFFVFFLGIGDGDLDRRGKVFHLEGFFFFFHLLSIS